MDRAPTQLTHAERHRAAENMLAACRPDYYEAFELLAALECALKRRFDEHRYPMITVLERFDALSKELNRADDLQGPSDEA